TAPTLYQKAAIFLIAYAVVFALGISTELELAVVPLAGLFYWHLRASARRLRSVVMAAVLSVAEAHGMSVVGDPGAFRRPPKPEPEELVPVRAARVVGSWALGVLSWTQILRGRRTAVR
ncbi:MAG TPA: hypothetical protein VIC87_12135, partial [Vicinamibacteria bacterium]